MSSNVRIAALLAVLALGYLCALIVGASVDAEAWRAKDHEQ